MAKFKRRILTSLITAGVVFIGLRIISPLIGLDISIDNFKETMLTIIMTAIVADYIYKHYRR